MSEKDGVYATTEEIVAEARRIAKTHGLDPPQYELREIVRTTRHYIDGGMRWREATDCAVTIVLRLHGKAPAPWA